VTASSDVALSLRTGTDAGNDEIEFVTVFYHKEIPLLQLQGLSFDRFFKDTSSVAKIHVLWNEANKQKVTDEFERTIAPAYGRLRDKVNLIFVGDYYPVKESSWDVQQIAKLLAARIVQSKFYVILDAKNHFIRPTGLEAFIVGGKPVMQISHTSPDVSFECCRHYFDLDDYTLTKEAPDLATPFVFERKHVLGLMDLIEKKQGETFHSAFHEPIRWTCYEFSAYTTYLLMRQTYANHTYRRPLGERKWMSTFRGKYEPENAGTVNHVYWNPQYTIFGLHSQMRMNDADLLKLIDFYIDVSGIEFARQVQGTFFAMHHGYNAH
jgi:hypothetical protein